MSSNNKKQKLVRKLTNKEYRDTWVDESVKMIVPYQIQAIRKQKGWSQALLGEKAGMRPNAITRLEDTDYGNLSVNTLLRVAHGFDCGLLVKFVPFSRMVSEFEDVSPKGLEVESFESDFNNLQSWTLKSECPHLIVEVGTHENIFKDFGKTTAAFIAHSFADNIEAIESTEVNSISQHLRLIVSTPESDLSPQHTQPYQGGEMYAISNPIQTVKTDDILDEQIIYEKTENSVNPAPDSVINFSKMKRRMKI